jgi:hypothetical protein
MSQLSIASFFYFDFKVCLRGATNKLAKVNAAVRCDTTPHVDLINWSFAAYVRRYHPRPNKGCESFLACPIAD